MQNIQHREMLDYTVSIDDVTAALKVAEGFGLVTAIPDQMGATIYYQATAKGVVESERNGWLS